MLPAGLVRAQGLVIEPDTVMIDDVSLTEFNTIAYATITNTTAQTQRIRVVRNIVNISDKWETSICDKNLCHDPVVDSVEFDLAPAEKATLNVYIFPFQTAGTATIELFAKSLTQTNLTAQGYYSFRSATSATEETAIARMRLYPNPAAEFFTLEGEVKAASLQVLNFQGQLLRGFAYQSNEWWPVSDLPKGVYVIQLTDRHGRVIGRWPLVKQ